MARSYTTPCVRALSRPIKKTALPARVLQPGEAGKNLSTQARMQRRYTFRIHNYPFLSNLPYAKAEKWKVAQAAVALPAGGHHPFHYRLFCF